MLRELELSFMRVIKFKNHFSEPLASFRSSLVCIMTNLFFHLLKVLFNLIHISRKKRYDYHVIYQFGRTVTLDFTTIAHCIELNWINSNDTTYHAQFCVIDWKEASLSWNRVLTGLGSVNIQSMSSFTLTIFAIHSNAIYILRFFIRSSSLLSSILSVVDRL